MPNEPAQPPHTLGAPDSPAAHAVGWRLAGIVVTHSVIDFFSFVIVPILTVLEGRLSLTPGQGAILLAVGSLSSGLIQPLVALFGDKHDTRWLGTLGFIAAVIAISCTGFVTSFSQLLLIQIIGAAGVGAFHPPGAAVMGHLSGRRRSLGVSVFYAAGMIGGIAGNTITPVYVKHFSLEALAWLTIPGLIAAVVLALAVRGVTHRHHGARDAHSALDAGLRRARWNAVWLLYAANILRFTVNMALVQLVIRWTEHAALERTGTETLDSASRTLASTINGPLQAAMQVGMGVAGLAFGALIRPKGEKTVLIIVPALGAVCIAAFPYLADSQGRGMLPFFLTVLGGIGYAGVAPITISLAQRLLPHRTSLASALMMGGAWAWAAGGPPLAQAFMGWFGLSGAFVATGAMLLLASLLALPLPSKLITESN